MTATEILTFIPPPRVAGINGSDLLAKTGVSAGELWNAMQALERDGLIICRGTKWNRTEKAGVA